MSENIPNNDRIAHLGTEKIPTVTEIITEKRYRGCRGPDKKA
jgi:hypothetical protein